MDNPIMVKASAASIKGTSRTANSNNFYINGRSIYAHETNSVHISIESTDKIFIFAVNDSMDVSDPKKEIFISIARELKKYQNRVGDLEIELTEKVGMLEECVQGMSNLLTGVSVDEPEDAASKASFTGLLIQGKTACVLSLGTCKAFLLRNNSIKQLSIEWEKTERLLKLGIITKEQAKELSKRFGIPTEANLHKIRKSEEFVIKEGDVFLLCTQSLIEEIETENIYDILKFDTDTGTVVDNLAKEAVKEDIKDNVTIMVIRVEKTENVFYYIPRREKPPKKRIIKKLIRGRKRSIPFIDSIDIRLVKKCTVMLALLILIGSLLFGSVKLISAISKKIRSYQDDRETLSDDIDPIRQNNGSGSGNGDSITSNNGGVVEGEGENDGTSDSNIIIDSGSDIGAGNNNDELLAIYKVKKGDTLYGISKMFYNNPDKYKIIMEANNLKDSATIQIGQSLKIPKIKENNE